MIFYSYFEGVDNTEYIVVLHNDYQNGNYDSRDEVEYIKELGGNPFSISVQSGNLYKPYKLSTASLTLYISNPFKVLGNMEHLNLFCVLYERHKGETGYEIKWQGYCTQNSFSQSFINDKDLFTLNLQDPISTLSYRRFKPIDGREILTFYDVLVDNLKSLGCYNHIYITNTLDVIGTDVSKNVLEKLYTEQENWIDEKGVGMKQLEVLEECLKFLGLSLIPDADKVYIVSFDALYNGFNLYTHYEFVGDRSNHILQPVGQRFYFPNREGQFVKTEDVVLSNNILFGEDYISSNDTTISIETPKHLMKVSVDKYTYNSFSPKWKDENLWLQTNEHLPVGYIFNPIANDINYISGTTDYINQGYYYSHNERGYCLIENGSGSKFSYYDGYIWNNGNQENIEVYTINDEKRTERHFIRYLRYDNSAPKSLTNGVEVETYAYTKNGVNNERGGTLIQLPPQKLNYSLLRDYVTCVPVQRGVVDIKTTLEEPFVKMNNISWLFSGSVYKFTNHTSQPMVKFRFPKALIDKDKFLLINANFELFDNPTYLPISYKNNEGDFSKVVITPAFVYVKIRFGNKYYNAETLHWQEQEYITKLPISILDEDKENAFGKKWSIVNNVQFTYFLGDKKGYCLSFYTIFGSLWTNIEDTTTLFDEMEITIYRIKPWAYEFRNYSRCTCIEMSDFDVEILSRDKKKRYHNSIEDNKVEYTNTIKTDSFEPIGDIELKIHTETLGQHNHSTVYFQDKGKLHRLNHLYDKSNGTLLQQEHKLILNNTNQYKLPNIILESTIKGSTYTPPFSTMEYKHLPNKVFVIDSITEDIRYNTKKVTFIEKL